MSHVLKNDAFVEFSFYYAEKWRTEAYDLRLFTDKVRKFILIDCVFANVSWISSLLLRAKKTPQRSIEEVSILSYTSCCYYS